MEKVAVVVPVYKAHPNSQEIQSLSQCIYVLSNHPIIFIAPKHLDTSFYEKMVSGKVNYKVERFKNLYFKDEKSYSRLLLSVGFYKRFLNFEYILIYQLDAWVFKDDLLQWCEKGYDYIGSPWFKGWHNALPDSEPIGIGNGGFSLRKVKKHLKGLYSFAYIRKPLEVWKEFSSNKTFPGFLKLIADLSVRNNSFFLFNDYEKNEDRFWYFIIAKNFNWFVLPEVKDALKFSVETNPSHFIKNASDLPFGCHAWERYEPEFWKKYIQTE